MAQHQVRKRSADPKARKLERFSGLVQMDEDTHYNKVEDVVGSHVEDAVTFWAQNVSKNKDIMKIGCSLSEVCPHANSVFGNLDPKKETFDNGRLLLVVSTGSGATDIYWVMPKGVMANIPYCSSPPNKEPSSHKLACIPHYGTMKDTKQGQVFREVVVSLCPTTKIYGGLFSEDKCWYRCRVLRTIGDDKCLVRYIDYGNTEILNRSDIVEIPLELQFSSIAKKYRLWGLQIPSGQEVTQFDQGRTFLGSLIFEKEIKMRIKATYQDGTVIAQAEYGTVDIGEEVAKKGFAEKCRLTSGIDVCEEKKPDSSQLALRSLKNPIPLWGRRSNQSSFNRSKGQFNGRLTLDVKYETNAGNHVTFPKENLAAGDFNLGSNVSLAKIKQDQKLIEENEKLKTEKEVLLENYKALELKVEQTVQELQQEKTTTMDLTKHLETTLKTCVGTRLKNLAAKVELLKEIRHINISIRFGNDLSDAMEVLNEGSFTTLESLNELEKIWAEYNVAQEKIKTCHDENEGSVLIAKRNEVQQNLFMAVDVFILEVDELPLDKRLKTLQDLSTSLEAVYGKAKEGTNSEEILTKFYDWQCNKREEFASIRSETEASLQHLVAWFQNSQKVFDLSLGESLTSEDMIGNIDEILEKTESCVCKELEISLIEQGVVDKEIILSTYSQVLQMIHSEEKFIATLLAKYKDSVEFKNQIIDCLNKSPSVDYLLSIKKTLKGLKAQLRWKLVEKSNLEESDDHDGTEIEKIKQEITQLRNSVFQEIYHEREEYEKLNTLTQKWFPELPLLYPEIGLLKYMNSGGLLTMSLERDLLDTEPMKELSSKRPLVCSDVNGQPVLLKGYSVDVDTEGRVIQRAASYHRACGESKEESGLLPLIFLFLCKSDPVAYLMVPYYPKANLSAIQASMPLTSEEALKVMKGVARGLHTLHNANIIHGSLHQNNVFALNREQGIVGDFDFTKSESQRASVNMMVGGLSLISPELKIGKPPSASSDLYAYGCLLLWLSVHNQEFETNEDGIPKVDQFHLDANVKSLLCSLIYFRSSMTAEQVLNAECFLLPKGNSVPNPEKEIEYTQHNKEDESKVESLDRYKERQEMVKPTLD